MKEKQSFQAAEINQRRRVKGIKCKRSPLNLKMEMEMAWNLNMNWMFMFSPSLKLGIPPFMMGEAEVKQQIQQPDSMIDLTEDTITKGCKTI